MISKNQAFIFIKPHAATNFRVLEYINNRLTESGLVSISKGEITGGEIAEKGLIDKHYSVNANVGTTSQPESIFLSDEAKSKFEEKFNTSWDQALTDKRVVSGLFMQQELGGISGDELNRVWNSYPVEKIAGGVYVAFFKEQDRFVLNGFYPSIREVYTDPDAKIIYQVVEFDSADMPWNVFRAQFIGATNPASADQHSIRGFLYHHIAEFNLELNYRDNVIHASASPFEALIEKTTWLENFDLALDPLMSGLGLDLAVIQKWYTENPVITCNSQEGKLIDILEDKNTDEVIEILSTLR